MNLYSKLISKLLIPVLTTGTIVGGAATYTPSKTEIIKGIESLSNTIIILKQKLDVANNQIDVANNQINVISTEMLREQAKNKEIINNLNAEIARLNDEIDKSKVESNEITSDFPSTNTDLLKIIDDLNKPKQDTNVLLDSEIVDIPTN